jgi:hypothetical protein
MSAHSKTFRPGKSQVATSQAVATPTTRVRAPTPTTSAREFTM